MMHAIRDLCTGLAVALSVFASLAAAADDGRLAREAVDVARELFASDSYYDQIAGAGTLAEIGDDAALELLVAMLEHPDHSLKRSALDTLLDVRHPAAVDAVQRISANAGTGLFAKFLSESLANRPREGMTPVLLAALGIEDIWIRKHALQALSRVELDGNLGALLAIAEDARQDPVSRAYANFALLDTEHRATALAVLIELSATGSIEAKEVAAVGLGRADAGTVRTTLARMHAETDPFVKIAVMASEAGFGDETAIRALIDTITHGGGLEGPAAAASLRRLPAATTRQITAEVIECCELGVNTAARLLEAWAWVHADPATVLDWGLAHASADVRMQAIWLVGEREDGRYLDIARQLLRDADAAVRGMAAWTLLRLVGDAYVPGAEA